MSTSLAKMGIGTVSRPFGTICLKLYQGSRLWIPPKLQKLRCDVRPRSMFHELQSNSQEKVCWEQAAAEFSGLQICLNGICYVLLVVSCWLCHGSHSPQARTASKWDVSTAPLQGDPKPSQSYGSVGVWWPKARDHQITQEAKHSRRGFHDLGNRAQSIKSVGIKAPKPPDPTDPHRVRLPDVSGTELRWSWGCREGLARGNGCQGETGGPSHEPHITKSKLSSWTVEWVRPQNPLIASGSGCLKSLRLRQRLSCGWPEGLEIGWEIWLGMGRFEHTHNTPDRFIFITRASESLPKIIQAAQMEEMEETETIFITRASESLPKIIQAAQMEEMEETETIFITRASESLPKIIQAAQMEEMEETMQSFARVWLGGWENL